LISYIPKDNQINQLLSNSSEKIGLIVNERFANLPPNISLPSYQQLLNDLKTAKDNKKLTLDLDLYLMVCKLLKTKPTNSKKTNNCETIYVNAEDEIFDELADHSFEYSVANQCDSDVFDWKDDDNLLEPFRKVFIIKNQNFRKAIDKLNDEFNCKTK
jgi:protein BCP1